MKNINYKLFILLILFVGIALPQQKWFAGANAHFLMPMGSLSDRFKPTVGIEVFIGKETSPNWSWSGSFEYYKFSKQNDEVLKIQRVINSVTYTYPFPKDLQNLQVGGLVANAKYKVYKSNLFDANIGFGIGVYNWKYTRNAYFDSLFTSDSSHTFAGTIKLTSNQQMDWSGGFNLGLSVDMHLTEFLDFDLGANYRCVIGELWPALDVNMENVSTFQMWDFKAGIAIRF